MIRKFMRGFTLIELMVALAVIGILTAIAYPSYSAYIQRGYRANAKATLLEAAQFMERYRSSNFRYLDGSGNAPTLPGRLQRSPDSGLARYSVVLSAVSANSYTLSATPSGWADDDCGSLTLDNLGQKGETGNKDVNYCWNR